MSILAVTAPATRRGLTAIATVKRELGITGSADHEFLEDLILQASAVIEGWCSRVGVGDLRQGNVPMTPERIAALIAQFGQPVTLQRMTGTRPRSVMMSFARPSCAATSRSSSSAASSRVTGR